MRLVYIEGDNILNNLEKQTYKWIKEIVEAWFKKRQGFRQYVNDVIQEFYLRCLEEKIDVNSISYSDTIKHIHRYPYSIKASNNKLSKTYGDNFLIAVYLRDTLKRFYSDRCPNKNTGRIRNDKEIPVGMNRIERLYQKKEEKE